MPSSQARNTAQSHRQMSMEHDPEYAAFRRQSEQNKFNLSRSSLTGLSAPTSRNNSDTAAGDSKQLDKDGSGDGFKDQKSFFDIPRNESPVSLSPVRTIDDHQHARLSLPSATLQTPPLDRVRQPQRSDTLPGSGESPSPTMVSPSLFVELTEARPKGILLLDLRVYPQFSSSRIRGALNLCIPTTLLKRPSFTVQKLADTFNDDHDRERFSRWKECSHICVYDANSNLPKEAVLPLIVLKKFASEGWHGQGLVIKGGFLAFSKAVPSMIEKGPPNASTDSKQTLSISTTAKGGLSVAGGCSMPSAKTAANPFFGNIRQNMDLLDGVGQMPIRCPDDMSEQCEHALPSWLRKAAKHSNEGKMVSDVFLSLEKSEQRRMQQALSCHVSYGSPVKEQAPSIQIAGIEKGAKNRYNNIFPYDHTRVRLHDIPAGACDYVNANYVKASLSNRKYIATQAPIPATFTDFWRVVWEQEVRVIVMLTAEKEGGQIKGHPYWHAGDYGPFKVKQLSQKHVSLESKHPSASNSSTVRRPTLGQRRSTNPNTLSEKRMAEADLNSPRPTDPPYVVIRHFTLSHASYPFQPMREVTQLHYSQWPDFGAPAEPTALLELIELVNKYVRSSSSPKSAGDVDEAAPEGQRPIMVHCSAGCGRTGAFCAIDSVIDMLKRQRQARARSKTLPKDRRARAGSVSVGDRDGMDIDPPDDLRNRHAAADDRSSWLYRDDIDLISRTVEEFRQQRLSMVQNLRQFVLCYETVLEWLVRAMSEDDGNHERVWKVKESAIKEGRWSYQG